MAIRWSAVVVLRIAAPWPDTRLYFMMDTIRV